MGGFGEQGKAVRGPDARSIPSSDLRYAIAEKSDRANLPFGSEAGEASGIANFWYAGEWHKFPDDTWDWFFEDFRGFYDEDRDMNSVDFIYWINGSGMAELIMEQGSRRISLRRWQREAKHG